MSVASTLSDSAPLQGPMEGGGKISKSQESHDRPYGFEKSNYTESKLGAHCFYSWGVFGSQSSPNLAIPPTPHF